MLVFKPGLGSRTVETHAASNRCLANGWIWLATGSILARDDWWWEAHGAGWARGGGLPGTKPGMLALRVAGHGMGGLLPRGAGVVRLRTPSTTLVFAKGHA